MNHIGYVKHLEKLFNVLKIILTLLHGRGCVERDFSVNKSSFWKICQCKAWSRNSVYDCIKSKNLTPKYFIVCGTLLKRVRDSRIKCESYLEEQIKAKLNNQKAFKCKSVQDSIDVFRKKKASLESTVSELVRLMLTGFL